MKKRAILALFLSAAVLLSGCSTNNTSSTTASQNSSSASGTESEGAIVLTTVDTSQMFSDRDLEIGYDEETSAKIELSGNSAACDSDAVQISGSTVTITDEGAYILSGALSDGTIIINAGDTDKVQLVLDGVDINSSTSAAIYVIEADKVFLTTASGSENRLSNGGAYVAIDENNIDAVVFSKSDLTLNGAGTLTIQAAAGHGVVSKDDLILASGTYHITAAGHGLSGKDSVRIADGTYTIVSGKDGVHAENADDASLGFLYVANGTFQITAEGDGMSAESYLFVQDGQYTIQAGGGSANAVQSASQTLAPANVQQTENTEDSSSTKGIKAVTDLTISGGTFSIDSADDSLHSNGNLSINGGTIAIASGDDGIHADSAVAISDGDINISQSYEGIEGLSIDITGGNISLVASDDGLNAAGGNDSSGFGDRGGDNFGFTEGAYIQISGGSIFVDASGDGIDSNGDLTVTGGETYVCGPTHSRNGSLDYAGEAVVSGGIFLAAGASGMAQNFGSSSTQGSILATVNSGSAGSTISLTDSSGNELISWQPNKEYSCVLISCPEITQGSTYTLTADGSSTQITMDSLIYGSGGMGAGNRGAGGMGGGNRGAGNNMNGENTPPANIDGADENSRL